jgi:subtilisin family serine protease
MWRVMWQVHPTMTEAPAARALTDNANTIWSGLDLVGAAEPVFKEPPSDLRATVRAMSALADDPTADMSSYFHVFVQTLDQARTLCDRLRGEPTIGYVDFQGRWGKPVRFGVSQTAAARALVAAPAAQTPNLVGKQGYLQAAPGGVDALYAWSVAGGRGQGIRICDVESGWNFHHEDLVDNLDGLVYGANDDDDHGTAVLGIFHGDNNAFGITGIASEARTRAASADYDGKKWNAAAAIKYAVDSGLKPGDVILLEMHAPGPLADPPDPSDDQKGFIAVEYWAPEYSAIRYAVAKGIYVVEAAGNGSQNLDDPVYQSLFSRATRDSGAILVGGGESSHGQQPRSRMRWSNYGSRLDIQGWGIDIVTSGGRSEANYYDLIDNADQSRCYTQSFGGTSGASPIVTGVVANISGAVRAAGRAVLPPAAMRQLLVQTGTPQTGPAELIGPLPNLRGALQSLGIAPQVG